MKKKKDAVSEVTLAILLVSAQSRRIINIGLSSTFVKWSSASGANSGQSIFGKIDCLDSSLLRI